MTYMTGSLIEYESCVCGFAPDRQRRRKIRYDAMKASTTPYHHIRRVEKGCAEVPAAACNRKDVFGRVHVRENLGKDLEWDEFQT